MRIIDKLDSKEAVKKALEIEIDNQYIDIDGKKMNFSKFIQGEIKKILKLLPKNKTWLKLFNDFSNYKIYEVSTRINLVNEFMEALIQEYQEPVLTRKPFYKNDLTTDITYLKGVGPNIAKILNKMGIFTANDLLNHFPRKYLDYSQRTNISQISDGDNVTIFGTIASVSIFQSAKRKNLSILKIIVKDGTGSVSTTWFYQNINRRTQEHYKAQYPKGSNVILSGIAKYDKFSNCYTIEKQEATVINADFDETETIHNARIVPVYTLSENLGSKTLRRIIFNALNAYYDLIEQVLPEKMLDAYNLLKRKDAIKQIHFPDNYEVLEQARFSLAFEELFLMQLKFMVLREEAKRKKFKEPITIKENGLVDRFVKSLPFKLTNAQNNAFNEILSDLSSTEPMQRLLQGDVGSGKTVVACMTLLAVVENGYQGALMAPTEILAEQHYRNFINWLTPLGLHVGLFTGKLGAKTKRIMNEDLINGQTHIAIGTHALIQSGVEFNNLGAVVVDEQHRFGVKQRKELLEKGQNPQMLTMTATPIPRTLALSVHGDLDLTVIDELPAGRLPIITTFTSGAMRKNAYELIRNEIAKGNKAYIVFPLIDESETLSAKAATKEAERLKEKVFPDLKIGLLHGKLTNQEKDDVMDKFKNGDTDILVCTTVVEVGVDVPNATVMIIENAERFGLSQLHQLRGRVGRSSKQSYCILISDTRTPETRQRLDVMTQTNNGFVIAQKDFELRGPGEFLGTRQSGVSDLLIADLVHDVKTLEMARDAAIKFSNEENLDDYPKLKTIIMSKIDEVKSYLNAG